MTIVLHAYSPQWFKHPLPPDQGAKGKVSNQHLKGRPHLLKLLIGRSLKHSVHETSAAIAGMLAGWHFCKNTWDILEGSNFGCLAENWLLLIKKTNFGALTSEKAIFSFSYIFLNFVVLELKVRVDLLPCLRRAHFGMIGGGHHVPYPHRPPLSWCLSPQGAVASKNGFVWAVAWIWMCHVRVKGNASSCGYICNIVQL